MKSRWIAAAVLSASALGWTIAAPPTPAAMASAATQFLASLTPEQRQQATFTFDGPELSHWHFIPTENFPRSGLTIKQMNPAQRTLAHELLGAGLSKRGYLTATQIMDLENVLGALESANPPSSSRFVRDPERYFFSIFGTPSANASWGWRVEGHHVSLHFTLVNGTLVASSPTFFGSNPGEVRSGPRTGIRILAAEEDAGRSLVQSLPGAQRVKAIINTTAPGDIITMANIKVDPLSPAGIAFIDMNANQQELLKRLIDVYVGKVADDLAADRTSRIEQAGWNHITFAWAGSIERGQKHYYRVQGPTFLIEYDNTQNDGNHIHSVWRDFNGDFGADLLRQHVNGTPHGD